MIQNKNTDLKIVMILTFLSLIYLFIPSLNQYPQNLVPYLLILIILPGYALLSAFKPADYRTAPWRRMLWGTGLGVLLYVVVYILWTFTPIPLYISPVISFLSPLEPYFAQLLVYITLVFILATIFIVDLVFVAWARRNALPLELEKDRYLYCANCRGFYQLTDEESPEDFESCQCGGKLKYSEKEREEGSADVMKISSRPEKQSLEKKGIYYLDLLLILLATILCSLPFLQAFNGIYKDLAGVLLILFIPGYALINMWYPKADNAGQVERLVYSVAASISLTAVLGLVMNFTSWNTLDSVMIVLIGLSVIFTVAAFLRRRSTPIENRHYPNLIWSGKGGEGTSSKKSFTEKMLTLLLVLSLFLLAFTTFITANPLEGKPYTEFILVNGSSPVNSLNMTSGENVNLTLTLVNHENKKSTYHILVNSGSAVLTDQTVTLDNKEKKDLIINITAGEAGNRTLEFKIYKLPNTTNIYQLIKIPLIITEAITEEEVTTETTEEGTE